MRTMLAAVAALLLTTGCDRPEAPAPAPAPAPTPVPAAPPPAPATVPPADGAALAFVDAAGAPTATLSCGSEGLRIVVPGFRPIGSEDRLSIGTEGEAFALVADLAAPGPGVTASGAPDPDLLDRLSRGEALFASYGQQSAGPLAAASPTGLQALISACRGRD
ncbi:MAG: hypothetical protein ACXW3O_04635 [Brevundimonas sp.]